MLLVHCSTSNSRGLQTSLLGQNLSFSPTEPPFVQILHVGHINWNTIVAVDNLTMKVYDSLYHQNLGPSTSMQVASILQSPHNQLTFSIENTQTQHGGADCGLFTIAYATEICCGNCPECYRYLQITISYYVIMYGIYLCIQCHDNTVSIHYVIVCICFMYTQV